MCVCVLFNRLLSNWMLTSCQSHRSSQDEEKPPPFYSPVTYIFNPAKRTTTKSSQLIFRGLSNRGTASSTCGDEQGDQFYSKGRHGGFAVASPMQGNSHRQFGENEVEWAEKVQPGKKFLAIGEACMAIF